MDKTPRQASLQDIAVQAVQLSTDVQLARDRGLRIVQLDEFVAVSYTHLTLPTNREV